MGTLAVVIAIVAANNKSKDDPAASVADSGTTTVPSSTPGGSGSTGSRMTNIAFCQAEADVLSVDGEAIGSAGDGLTTGRLTMAEANGTLHQMADDLERVVNQYPNANSGLSQRIRAIVSGLRSAAREPDIDAATAELDRVSSMFQPFADACIAVAGRQGV